MNEVGQLKWIEAGLLLAAGAAFGWWQLRDVKRAQEETRRKRAIEEAQLRQQDESGPAARKEDEP